MSKGLSIFVAFFVALSIGTSFSAGNYPAITQEKIVLRDQRGLELHHYRPRGTPRDVVLLWPGIGTNSRIFDLNRRYSLARYLQEKRYSVWTVDSQPESLDRSVDTDIPETIQAIVAEESTDRLAVIAFDLGGLAFLRYLIENPSAAIDRLVTLGTVTFFQYPSRSVQELLDRSRAFSGDKIDPLQGAVEKVPFARGEESYFDLLVWNQPFDTDVKEEFLREGLKPIPRPWIGTVRTGYQRGEAIPSEELKRLKRPILLIGGKLDPLAHPALMRKTFNAIGSEEKTLRIFSIGYHDRANYSHLGLLLSPPAPEEVYPFVEQWLHERRTEK